MPPKGMTAPNTAKQGAASDTAQQKLGVRPTWELKAGAPLPPAPKAKVQKVSSTRDALTTDQIIEMECRSVVNDMIDTIVTKTEKQPSSRRIEVRSWLNAVIDQVIVNCNEAAAKASAKVKQEMAAIKAKRTVYTVRQRESVIAAIDACGEAEKKSAIARLNLMPGYEKVTVTMVDRWRQSGAAKPRGRKVNEAFEAQVLGQLVYSEMENVEGVEQAVVKANIAHSHATIKRAAMLAKSWFPDDEPVQKLKFSPPWVVGFLKRVALRRRRVTTQDKSLPPVGEVRRRMAEIQKVIVDDKYTRAEVINADETGIFFGAPPKNQYIPESAARATAPESDDKARFTSLLWGDSDGEMQESFNIVSMAVKGTDLSSSRVLDNMMLLAGFTKDDGWEKKIWRRTLTLNVKNKPVTSEYVRPYLIQASTGHVITVQAKAWMDTAGICMWADVQLGPHFAKTTKRCLVVWDNCGPHKVPAVAAVFKEWGIRAEELPPKMTDILQVMDLVVNGPVKAGIRRARIDALFSFFQSWKIKRLQHLSKKDGTPPPEFTPPKPKQSEGLMTLFKVMNEVFLTDKFKLSMRKCFEQVGLAKGDDGQFVVYHPTKRGVLNHLMGTAKTSDDSVSVGEIACELAITSRGASKVVVIGTVRAVDPGAASSSDAPVQAVLEQEEVELTDDESDAHSSDDEQDD